MTKQTKTTEPKPFVTKFPCNYQQHSKRIATMMAEQLHDGNAWKPESHERYAELELLDQIVVTVSSGAAPGVCQFPGQITPPVYSMIDPAPSPAPSAPDLQRLFRQEAISNPIQLTAPEKAVRETREELVENLLSSMQQIISKAEELDPTIAFIDLDSKLGHTLLIPLVIAAFDNIAETELSTLRRELVQLKLDHADLDLEAETLRRERDWDLKKLLEEGRELESQVRELTAKLEGKNG